MGCKDAVICSEILPHTFAQVYLGCPSTERFSALSSIECAADSRGIVYNVR